MTNDRAFEVFKIAAQLYCREHDIPESEMWKNAPDIIKRNYIVYQRDEITISVKWFDGVPRIAAYSNGELDELFVSVSNPKSKEKQDKRLLEVKSNDTEISKKVLDGLMLKIAKAIKITGNPKNRLYYAIFGEEAFK